MPIIRIVKEGNFVRVRCITLLENERKLNYLVSCRSEPLIILCKGSKTPLHAEVSQKLTGTTTPNRSLDHHHYKCSYTVNPVVRQFLIQNVQNNPLIL